MPGFEDRDGLIWFDGQWVDWRDAKVHVLTHTLHYGMGVFEVFVLMKPQMVQQFSVLKSIQIVCLIRPKL